jgi:hypothetical protein
MIGQKCIIIFFECGLTYDQWPLVSFLFYNFAFEECYLKYGTIGIQWAQIGKENCSTGILLLFGQV